MKKVLMALVLAFWAVLLLTAKPALTAPEEIRIGLNATMSGAGAQWGIAFDRANKARIEEINKEGGLMVGGKRYTIIYFRYDNKADPPTSLENAKTLINVDKVNFIFHHASANILPYLPITSEKKIISMDLSVGSKTLGWPYNFNLLPAGSGRAEQAFKSFVKKFGIKKVAEINPDNESGQVTKAEDGVAAKQQGVEILSSLFYTPGTTDFYPILTKSLIAKPEMLVLGVPSPRDVALIVKQARELGWTGPIGGAQCVAPPAATFAKIAGKAAEGFMWSAPYSTDSNFWTKEERAWATYWKEHWTDPFIADSFGGCRQIGFLTEAIKKADSLDPDKIVRALETSNFVILGWKMRFGVTPECYQGRPRSLVSPLCLKTIKEGKEIVTQVILPPGVERVD
jgi:branched-chain amino acid transport system substrate-binding protein